MADTVLQKILQLISDKKEGAAYSHLREQYAPALLRFAFSYVKNHETAEEITADVLYRVWLNRERLVHIRHLKIYLFTSVRNACLRHLYKRKKEEEMLNSQVDVSDRPSDCPESLYIASELSKCITNAVEKLPPRCKLIFKLIKEEGLRNKDVAQQLGISINTIDVQLAIALKRIGCAISSFNGKKAER